MPEKKRPQERETWVTEPLGGVFVARHRLVSQDEHLVPAEVVISIAEGQSLPPGGIPSWAVRRVNVSYGARAAGEEVSASVEYAVSALDQSFFAEMLTPSLGRRTGSTRSPDTAFLWWAVRYAAAVARGSRRPAADIVVELRKAGEDVTEAQVRQYVLAARRRGLLSHPPKHGVPGGSLTRKALDLLIEREGRTG